MTIRPASASEIRFVAENMRDRDFEEWSATTTISRRSTLANMLVERYAGRDDVLVGLAEGLPVCIGGTIEVWPGVISLMFFSTEHFHLIGRAMTRWLRRELFPRYVRSGVHRIQAISLDGYDEIHAWLRAIGLEQEAVFKRFGRDGQDFVQFAMVRDVRPLSARK